MLGSSRTPDAIDRWLIILVNIKDKFSNKMYLVYLLDSHYQRYFMCNIKRILYIEYDSRRYILATSDNCKIMINVSITLFKKGDPYLKDTNSKGAWIRESSLQYLINFRLHTSFTIKICCNRKSPYFEVSTGCGLKFPSESIDDCFSIILT